MPDPAPAQVPTRRSPWEVLTDRLPRAALPPGDEGEQARLYLRRFRLFASVFLVYLAYAFDGLSTDDPGRLVLACVLLAVFVLLYLGPLPLGAFLDVRAGRVPVLLAMVAVMAAHLVLVGPGGLVLTTYVALSLVVCLPPAAAFPLVLLLCAATALLPQHVAAWDLDGAQWGVAGPALLVSTAMYAVRRGSRDNRDLFRARREVERLAAEQERMRIARDLHDLLGHALTTVVVKAELATRLVARDPERAAREMAEVAELGRRGLADVRATVEGYREVSLVTELATAREVLRAAGIVAELPASVEQVPVELRELFGWVVREGVTNAVRHSRAGHLRVLLQGRAVEVVDDGLGGEGSSAGSGLRGLRERSAALGGRVTAGPVLPRGYRLRVEVPA